MLSNLARLRHAGLSIGKHSVVKLVECGRKICDLFTAQLASERHVGNKTSTYHDAAERWPSAYGVLYILDSKEVAIVYDRVLARRKETIERLKVTLTAILLLSDTSVHGDMAERRIVYGANYELPLRRIRIPQTHLEAELNIGTQLGYACENISERIGIIYQSSSATMSHYGWEWATDIDIHTPESFRDDRLAQSFQLFRRTGKNLWNKIFKSIIGKIAKVTFAEQTSLDADERRIIEIDTSKKLRMQTTERDVGQPLKRSEMDFVFLV